MTRGLRAALRWRLPYWTRLSPGLLGGAFFLLVPLLAFLPLEHVPVFEERLRGVAIITWLLGMALGLRLMGKRGPREEDAIWLYQKGFSLRESALEDWLLDLGLAAGFAVCWATVGTAALAATGTATGTAAGWAGLFALALTTSVLTYTLVLALSSWGVEKATDLTILIIFVSLFAPALVFRSGDRVRWLVDRLAPPFADTAVLHGAIRTGTLDAAVGALLEIVVFTGLFLVIGLWGIASWRPKG